MGGAMKKKIIISLLLIIPFKIKNLATEESAFTRGKKLYKIKIRRKEGEIFRLQMFSLAKKGGVCYNIA